MRLTFLFLLIGFMQAAATAYSQSTKLTLDMNSVKVSEVLDAIESQSEFRFAYSPGYINLDRQVSVDLYEKSIDETLQVVFSGTDVEYAIHDRHIILYPEAIEPDNSSVERIISQQQRVATGTVTDNRNLPLPGVTVVVKGTVQGTVTDADGKFSLTLPSDATTLQFSFVGMRTQEIEIGNRTTFNVSLEEETIGIDEVVAIGYGTQRRSLVTNAISRVNFDEENMRNVLSPSQLLEGRVAGVTTSTGSGNLGSSERVSIRGMASISASNEPLYVIDG
ncbi:MAG TPA: carboxypeptidase-like regulatory domain-containing protein, partial [Mariniphaga sp.]|nr:carboxypeptidase-like regulatory domain-containing protein [Mariniphaga sp.]